MLTHINNMIILYTYCMLETRRSDKCLIIYWLARIDYIPSHCFGLWSHLFFEEGTG